MTELVFNNINDIRKYAITVLKDEIKEHLSTVKIAKQENIPINFSAIFEAITRYQNLIEHYKIKLLDN